MSCFFFLAAPPDLRAELPPFFGFFSHLISFPLVTPFAHLRLMKFFFFPLLVPLVSSFDQCRASFTIWCSVCFPPHLLQPCFLRLFASAPVISVLFSPRDLYPFFCFVFENLNAFQLPRGSCCPFPSCVQCPILTGTFTISSPTLHHSCSPQVPFFTLPSPSCAHPTSFLHRGSRNVNEQLALTFTLSIARLALWQPLAHKNSCRAFIFSRFLLQVFFFVFLTVSSCQPIGVSTFSPPFSIYFCS